MTLDIEPEVEHSLRTYAAAEGVSPETLFIRLLARYEAQSVVNEADWKIRLRSAQQRAQEAFVASGKTEEVLGDEIDAKLPRLRQDALNEYRKHYPADNRVS